MNFLPKTFAAFVCSFLVAASANAQVCKESNGNVAGKANMDCDMRYRDQIIACDKKSSSTSKDIVGTRPSCPSKPMPMIDTPSGSYIADYSPYLFQYPRDAADPSKPYSGAYALGTPGDASRTFQIFGNTAPGTKRLAACTTQIKLPADPKTDGEWAQLIRLQLDNCTNQYILNAAIYPVQKESTQLLSLDDPQVPGKKIGLESECQPLKTFSGEKNEYEANVYLEAAWRKLLFDADYRKTTGSLINTPCVGGLTRDLNIPCDREPHLPKGTTIENRLPPPSPFPEVRLSNIASVPYEEINDPTHPFSPRWDFLLDDRDYGNLSLDLIGKPGVALAIRAGLEIYMSEVKNSVFCAGVRKADGESDKKKKADAEVRVDVLEFRRKAFEDSLKKRVLYNSVCKVHKAVFNKPDAPLIVVAPASFCFKITRVTITPPFIYARDKDCWECYRLNGKVDDETQHPPCTTQYLGKDLRINNGIPGGLNAFKRAANCGTKFDKICKDLRAPYTSLNKLKMRYHNPDDKDDKDGNNVVLKDGALEGMTHAEYFGNHMPYPKIWDLGQSLQSVPTSDKNNQPPLDTTGQYTAIVGVGREAAAKVAADAAPADADGKKAHEKFYDQRCKTQGWGDALPTGLPFAGVTVNVPDPISSWTETKLYQARTLRNVGLSCLGRYEKVFKPGSAENMMLLVAGAEWQRAIISKCPRLQDGKVGECTYMTIKEYTDAGNPENDNATVYMKQFNAQGTPLTWRGYLSAEKAETKFPAFGGAATTHATGLDNAELGDIVLLPKGPKDDGGLAKLGFVIATHLGTGPQKTNCESEKNCYIQVLEPDNGKWPDVCGSTDTWGEMKTRHYFKPGHLPQATAAEFTRISSTKDCEDTKLSHCEMSAWDALKIYRPVKDVRKGCKNKDRAADCEKDE